MKKSLLIYNIIVTIGFAIALVVSFRHYYEYNSEYFGWVIIILAGYLITYGFVKAISDSFKPKEPISCPGCHSRNIRIQIVPSQMITDEKAFTTPYYIINRKTIGRSTTKIQNVKIGVCQDCGCSWRVR